METAPFARQVVTIIGNISGVKPTAMEIANKNAWIQSPFVSPFITNTIGAIKNIKRMSTQETEFTPFVKLVSTASPPTADAIEPNNV